LSVSARQTKIVISELEDAPLRGALLLSWFEYDHLFLIR
jgi:hypothetical protein